MPDFRWLKGLYFGKEILKNHKGRHIKLIFTAVKVKHVLNIAVTKISQFIGNCSAIHSK